MTGGLQRAIQYRLERFLVGGAVARLAVIAGAIVLIVLVFGSLQWWIDGEPGLAGWLDTLWWAFLRMTDPGYLGDDQTQARRVIATIVTILGYVLFMGALIAIMTSWLHETMRRLEKGLTPITMKRHVVVLGWSERTPEILDTLLGADRRRLASFLRRHRAGRLRIAILAQDVGPHMEVELRQELGRRYDKGRIVLREGDAQNPLHLDRVNCRAAAGIVVAGGYIAGTDPHGLDPDARVMRICLTLAAAAKAAGTTPPWLVAPVVEPARIPALAASYGPNHLAPVCTPRFIGRLLAQAVLHPGLMAVFDELLGDNAGNAIFIRSYPDLEGRTFVDVSARFRDAVPIGIAPLSGPPRLAPSGATRLGPDDQLVLIARSARVEPGPPSLAAAASEAHTPGSITAAARTGVGRIAILGTSRLLPIILAELEGAPGFQEVRCCSRQFGVDQPTLARWNEGGATADGLRVEFTTGDYLDQQTLASLAPEETDAVLLLSGERLRTADEADARALLGHQVLRHHLDAVGHSQQRICVELRSPHSAQLLARADSEILIGGEVVSRALAQITLRPDLAGVYEALFAAEGPGLCIATPIEAGLDPAALPPDWPTLRRAMATVGAIAVGLHRGGHLLLNPAPAQVGPLRGGDRLVLLVG